MAARWRDHVDLSVVAPPRAHEILAEFLGDVDMHRLGSSPPIGPRLAVEYVRRSVMAIALRLPQADVALAASHFTPDAAALMALSRRGALGVGYVYHLVATRTKTDTRTLWSRNDERMGLAILSRYADLVFVSNEGTAATLTQRGFRPVKTGVGIDLECFRPGEEGARRPNRGLFLGRLRREQGCS